MESSDNCNRLNFNFGQTGQGASVATRSWSIKVWRRPFIWQFQFQEHFLYSIIGDPIQLRLPKPRSARMRPVLFWAKLRHRKEFQLQQQERPPPCGPTTEYMYQVGIKNVCVWSAIVYKKDTYSFMMFFIVVPQKNARRERSLCR